MVRCTDRPRLEVHVSFEATRLAPQHLIEAYARLAPLTTRRTKARLKLSDIQISPARTRTTMAGGDKS
jgi:hypothetical protein